MRIHLPLARAARPVSALEPRAARAVAPTAIGIADTADGREALDFALNLAVELSALGVLTAIRELAYQELATAERSAPLIAARSACDSSRHVVNLDGDVDPAIPSALGALTLLVGAPSIGSFVPRLAILVGAERALNLWPPLLRRLRSTLQLELAGSGVAACRPLALRLSERGFLPGR